jgi:hypothetical protein
MAITTDQYGEKTGAWLRDAQTGRLTEVAEAVSREQDVPPAHGHAKARPSRRPWWLRRKQAPAPVLTPLAETELLADKPGEFTQAISRWQSPVTGTGALERPAPAAEVTHEPADPEPTAAIAPADMPHDLITDPAPDPRPYAPRPVSLELTGGLGADGSPLVRDAIGVRPATWGELYALGAFGPINLGSRDSQEKEAAQEWAEWDTPENREPMQRYIPDLNADLADCPEFRATLAASAAIARRSLFGCAIGEGTWGGRMVSAGISLSSVPEAARAAFAAAKAEPAGREDTIMLRRVAA